MTSIEIRRGYGQPRMRRAVTGTALQQGLLMAGLLAALVEAAADLVCAMLYPGYSVRDQAISELSAIGAPTAHLWSFSGPIFEVLMIAFVIGVLRMANENRALRVTGVLLLVFALSGLLWAIFPMHQRGTETTWQDTGHVVMGGWMVALIATFVGTGGFALGKRFRAYSVATVVVLLVSGIATFMFFPRVAADQPTPWLGAIERVNWYGYLLWIAVLAVALTRRVRLPRSAVR